MNYVELMVKNAVKIMEITIKGDPDPVSRSRFGKMNYPQKCFHCLTLMGKINNYSINEADKQPRQAYIYSVQKIHPLIYPFVLSENARDLSYLKENENAINCFNEALAVIEKINPICLEPDKQLCQSLMGHRLPKNVDREYFEKHKVNRYWFIQVPPNVLYFKDNMFLTGVFMGEIGNCLVFTTNSTVGYSYVFIEDDRVSIYPSDHFACTADEANKAFNFAKMVILHYDTNINNERNIEFRQQFPLSLVVGFCLNFRRLYPPDGQ